MTRNSHSIKHDVVDATLSSDTTSSGDGARPPTDEKRFAEIVSQNIDFVWRTVRRLGVSAADADDATQQVFVVAHQKVDEIRVGSERAFLVAVSTRVASRTRRTNRRREQTQQHFSEIPVTNAAFSEHAVSRVEARDLLDRVMDGMPPDVRLVFVLFELEDLSVDKIAELLELPRGTVATRLRKARALFAEEATRVQALRLEGEL
jgi:RNA polymerase sigma-70 factor, ECF subfamily